MKATEARPTKRQPKSDDELRTFSILPLKRFDHKGGKVRIERGKELGCISRGEDNAWHATADALREYRAPDKGNNLSAGFLQFEDKRDRSKLTGVGPILSTLLGSQDAVTNQCSDVDFVTWRGNLTKILVTPYCRHDSWEIGVRRVNGRIFLDVRETEQEVANEATKTPEQRKMCYWGYKFETYATGSACAEDSDLPAPPDLRTAFCTIAKATVGQHRLILCGEVDCHEPHRLPRGWEKQHSKSQAKPYWFHPPSGASQWVAPRCYVELKTARVNDTERNARSFARYKLLKSWAQSVLIGVDKVIYGFRDDAGILLGTETFAVEEMPQEAQQRSAAMFQQPWDDTVCLNFLNAVLDWLREEVQDDEPRALCYGGQDKSDELVLVRAKLPASQELDDELVQRFGTKVSTPLSQKGAVQAAVDNVPSPLPAKGVQA